MLPPNRADKQKIYIFAVIMRSMKRNLSNNCNIETKVNTYQSPAFEVGDPHLKIAGESLLKITGRYLLATGITGLTVYTLIKATDFVSWAYQVNYFSMK